ncbi:hypothetical protein EON65_55675 [archaeon]|nr:MAG: hypothetical protein EON65_55675 [archaeon]
MHSVCYKEAQLAREQAKILKRREDNETRRQRYLQAKVRLIGVDVQALNAQVAEKERSRQNERDNNKYDRKFFSYSFHPSASF